METFQFKHTTCRGLSGHPWKVCPGRADCLRVLSDHPKMTIEFLRAACRPFPSIPGILIPSTGVGRHRWKGSTKLFCTWKTIGPSLPDIRRCLSGPRQSLAGHIQASISSSETDGLPSCSLQAAQKARPVHSKSSFERSRHPKIPIPFQQGPCHDPSKPR